MAAYITKRRLQNTCYLFIAARAPTVCRYVSKIAYVSTYFLKRTFFQSNLYLNRTYVSKVRLTMITECKLFYEAYRNKHLFFNMMVSFTVHGIYIGSLSLMFLSRLRSAASILTTLEWFHVLICTRYLLRLEMLIFTRHSRQVV